MQLEKSLKEKIKLLEETNILLVSKNKEWETRLNESQHLSKIGSWSWDVKLNTIEWSDSMFIILGLEPNGEIPTYELALKYVHNEDKLEYEQTLKNSLELKVDYYLKNRITREDKTTISVISQGKCFCNEEGDITRVIGTVQDVTINEGLLNRNLKLAEFATLVSLHATAPLKTIIGFVSLLKSSIYRSISEKDKSYIDNIETLATTLDKEIYEILEKVKA